MSLARRGIVILAAIAIPALGGLGEQLVNWGPLLRMEFFEQPNQRLAIESMTGSRESRTMDAYVSPFDAANYALLVDAGLNVSFSYGSFTEIELNPARSDGDQPLFVNGQLNATANKKVRQGIGRLIDRGYIIGEFLQGCGVPRWTVLDPTMPAYADLLVREYLRETEVACRYDEVEGERLIAEGLKECGAVKVDGKWVWNGDPVAITGLIPKEGELAQIGHYVANLLEEVGLQVKWIEGSVDDLKKKLQPGACNWNFIVRCWYVDRIHRSQQTYYQGFYSPIKGCEGSATVFTQLSQEPSSVFRFRDAEECAADLAYHHWLYTAKTPWATATDVCVCPDLAAGLGGSYLAFLRPYFSSLLVGGSMRVAASSLLAEPWNPVGGSTKMGDRTIQKATEAWFLYPDPNTGLFVPFLVESAVVTAAWGTSVHSTLDWVSVERVDTIPVPGDAWAGWDGSELITAAKKYPNGATARTKTTCTFTDDLLTMKWHDGSTFSIADMLMHFIFVLDRANPNSVIFDASAVDPIADGFKGARILSKDPVVIEVYHDRAIYKHAEEQVFRSIGDLFWPYYGTGMAPWHTVTVGMLAENAGLCVFSKSKAENLGVSRQDWIKGDSLQLLSGQLDTLRARQDAVSKVRYAQVLYKTWISDIEIGKRYQLLKEFYDTHGHLWVSNGWWRIDSIDPAAKRVVCMPFYHSVGAVGKHLQFSSEPGLASMSISGPTEVTPGDEAQFGIELMCEDGEPYPNADDLVHTTVLYFVFRETGEVVASGYGMGGGDGIVHVSLSAEETAALSRGAWMLEVIAVLRSVAVTSTGMLTFNVE